ncbi:MAG: hypothetical protein WAV41_02875 [Microgenomates group bacterium]
MKSIVIPVLQFVLVVLIASYFTSNFYDAYRTNIRNTAIDGCYQISSYEAQYKENDRLVTITQPQDYIFQQCLVNKSILINPNR